MGIIKDPTSWRAGFELGLAGFSFPYSKPRRKPTAYLYNGIRLPALPEWDRGVYPFAVLYGLRYETGELISATLSVYSEPMHNPSTQPTLYLLQCDSPVYWQNYKWNEDDAFIFEDEGYTESGVFAVPWLSEVWWTNYDVANTDDDSVYFAASEPVPVYD